MFTPLFCVSMKRCLHDLLFKKHFVFLMQPISEAPLFTLCLLLVRSHKPEQEPPTMFPHQRGLWVFFAAF